MPESSSTLRYIQITAAVLGCVLVMIFGPRMDGPRMIGGVAFKTKGGGPGLTNLGFLLLVGVPVITYFVVGIVGRLIARGRSR